METTTIIIGLACLIAGLAGGYLLFRYVVKQKYNQAIKEAEQQAETIKKNKLLEVKEKFLNKKSELEKEVAQRTQKLQQAENKLKQLELSLTQRHEDLQKKKVENENLKTNLERQIQSYEGKKTELDKMVAQERTKLVAISGLSAEEAKNQLMESMKDEARTEAMQ